MCAYMGVSPGVGHRLFAKSDCSDLAFSGFPAFQDIEKAGNVAEGGLLGLVDLPCCRGSGNCVVEVVLL